MWEADKRRTTIARICTINFSIDLFRLFNSKEWLHPRIWSHVEFTLCAKSSEESFPVCCVQLHFCCVQLQHSRAPSLRSTVVCNMLKTSQIHFKIWLWNKLVAKAVLFRILFDGLTVAVKFYFVHKTFSLKSESNKKTRVFNTCTRRFVLLKWVKRNF